MIYKNKPCPHCGRYTNRGVTVNSLIINENKIVLIERGVNPYKGYWGLPGGYVGWDESAEEAAIRETKEETGLQIKNLIFICVNTNPQRHPKQAINIAYLSTKFSGDFSPSDDAAKAKWFSLDELPKELAFDHKDIIKLGCNLR